MPDKARSNRTAKIVIGVVCLVVVLAGGGVILGLATRAQAAPPQPIAFNHQVMVQAGVDCLFCHGDAMRSPSAGIPSVGKCMGCHKIIATDNPEVKKLADYWTRNAAIPWVRVNELPRFVYFSHQVHVAAGLNCEQCHGDVGHMAVVRPVVVMNMGWCLNCHSQQSNAPQLRDCVVCHK
jgi:hypothetical protein